MSSPPDWYKSPIPTNHIAPCPRRVRAFLASQPASPVIDTTSALYVWEWKGFPQFYIPIEGVDQSLLEIDDGKTDKDSRGTFSPFYIRDPGSRRGLTPGGKIYEAGGPVFPSSLGRLLRFDWSAFASWYEEDEPVYGHPRSPFVRIDCVRSSRVVRVELEGVVLAESKSSVFLYETDLPTRYYLDRTSVNFTYLRPTQTKSRCPYKGITTSYWDVVLPQSGKRYPDLVWEYGFPLREVLPIQGLVCFYNEKVDIFLDGVKQARPITHFA